MTIPNDPQADDLQEFDAKLRAARQAHQEQDPDRAQQSPQSGLRYGMEFIGGVLAGALLGWFIDQLFDTAPFGLVVFLLLGFASGLLTAIRSAKKAADEAEEDGNDPDASASGDD